MSADAEWGRLLRELSAAPARRPPPTRSIGGRFDLRRRLGSGSFGVVYEAIDRQHGGEVGVKLLRDPEPSWLLHFKREFRALQQFSHPNLVCLHELCLLDGYWLFSMELVRGRDFVRYVRGDIPRGAPLHTEGYARLDLALRQLLSATATIHHAGKVHRDLKPSNVLVTSAGRVVLLDFGLLAEIGGEAPTIAGTPAYMAPEQSSPGTAAAESDLYAVGIMLYEALVGRRPFAGDESALLRAKSEREPPNVRKSAPNAPEELCGLASSLLSRAPTVRVDGLREWLRAGDTRLSTKTEDDAEAPFVGRKAELAILRHALDRARRGQTVLAVVRGDSGIGKSRLVREFVRILQREQPETQALVGRCHEREAIPYQALDEVVDELARLLAVGPSREAPSPSHLRELAQLFPVLLTSPLLAHAACGGEPSGTPDRARERAFSGLRELLTVIARRAPTVVVIDDLQWVGDDALHALRALTRPPHGPPLLVVVTMMPSDPPARYASALEQLTCERHELSLAPLSEEESHSLARTLLSDRTRKAALWSTSIVREAGGSPLCIEELARHASADALGVQGLRLHDVLVARIARLSAEERRICELVSVAGRPLRHDVLLRASGLAPTNLFSCLAALRRATLLRPRATGAAASVEPHHLRVQNALLARLPASRVRALHAMLARGYEHGSASDAAACAAHWHLAGAAARAKLRAELAASQAMRALAFDQATRWYALALELTDAHAPARTTLRIELAEALAYAGRGAQAAEQFAEAAAASAGDAARRLRRQAAEQLLQSGYFDRGISASRTLLSEVGIALPRSKLGTLAALIYHRTALRLRGLKLGREEKLGHRDELRIDLCFGFGATLGFVDPMVGVLLMTRALRAALAKGCVRRSARAMGYHVCAGSLGGTRSWSKTQRHMEIAQSLAEQSDDPQARAFNIGAAGIAHYMSGQAKEARPLLERARSEMERACSPSHHERVLVSLFLLRCLEKLGRYRSFAELQRQELERAIARDDLYASVNLRIGQGNLVWLMDDRPDLAERHARDALSLWSQSGFHAEHLAGLVALIRASLYRGDADAAYARSHELFERTRRSLLWRTQIVRNTVRFLHACAALKLAHGGGARSDVLLRQARDDGRAIAREGARWMTPFALVVRAGVLLQEGKLHQAGTRLTQAASAFEHAGFVGFAVAAEQRARSLVPAAAGRSAALPKAALYLAGQGVVDPARFVEMLLPALTC